MIGAVWGYLEGIARGELVAAADRYGVEWGLVVSLLGSSAAAWLGLRFGRVRPLMVSALVQVISLALLIRLSHYADPVAAFFVINAVFQIMWSYVVSYFIITFNDVDATGRFVAVYGTASHMALAVGPYVGGLLIADRSYKPLLWFGVIAVSAPFEPIERRAVVRRFIRITISFIIGAAASR